MRYLILTTLLLASLMVGCQKIKPIHVGAKDFTEQFILAEMIALLAEEQGLTVKRSIPYGQALVCAEAIKQDKLDVYVEYTGTGLLLFGQAPISKADKSYQRVKKLFAKRGLLWQERIGFVNDYVLLVRNQFAETHNLNTINDLVKIAGQIRFGCDPDYVERPLDGFGALTRSYGLQKTGEPRIYEDKAHLYDALLEKKIDVAVGYSTDGQIVDYHLKVLEDDRNFFPVYEAAPLVREKILKRHPKLKKVFEKLAGLIDTKTMREMNSKVELQGYDYRQIAQNFLEDKGLLKKAKKKKSKGIPPITVAIGQLNEISGPSRKGLQAIRAAFPGRPIEIVRSNHPADLVAKREARVGVLGAESFFPLQGRNLGRISQSVNKALDSVAVIGYNMAHLIVPKDSEISAISEMKKIAVGPKGANSDQVLRFLSRLLQLDKKLKIVHGTVDEHVSQLKEGKIDGIFLMLPPGNPRLTTMMYRQPVKLLPFPEWSKGEFVFNFPFFRSAKIAANTYAGQSTAIETMESQLVLAIPSQARKWVGDMGPATALYSQAPPLSDTTIKTLAGELESPERLHPILPQPQILKPKIKSGLSKLDNSPFESALNGLVILAVILALYLFRK